MSIRFLLVYRRNFIIMSMRFLLFYQRNFYLLCRVFSIMSTRFLLCRDFHLCENKLFNFPLKHYNLLIKLFLIKFFMFLGCMYSMAAFGPVLGFLLGAYLLSFHMDSFSKIISIGKSTFPIF